MIDPSKFKDFTNAKDMYFDKIKIPEYITNERSKYYRAAKEGLCFHCFRNESDVNRRPKHKGFAFCRECMIELAIGQDKIEMKKEYELHKWFKD